MMRHCGFTQMLTVEDKTEGSFCVIEKDSLSQCEDVRVLVKHICQMGGRNLLLTN